MTIIKSNSNYQDALKTLAIFLMIIDHLGLYLFPEMPVMRAVGRSVMPVFCFFAGYNFHDKPKSKIIILGLTLYAFTSFLFKQYTVPNILITIYLGQWYLYLFQTKLKKFFYEAYIHVIILALLCRATDSLMEYGTIGVAVMILGYIAKHDHKNLKLTVFISVMLSIFHTAAFFICNFSNNLITLTIIESFFIYWLMTLKNFNQKIWINLKPVSRNTLYIYFVHLAMIQVGFYLIVF